MVATNFNPRSPHGERPDGNLAAIQFLIFQSTLPARGATITARALALALSISIHAPRTGSDEISALAPSDRENFNPRSPHGERLKAAEDVRRFRGFQSTLPARGATGVRGGRAGRDGISIHAPRTGSDRSSADAGTDSQTISIHAPRTGSDRRRSP